MSSLLWSHFKKIDKNEAKCFFCIGRPVFDKGTSVITLTTAAAAAAAAMFPNADDHLRNWVENPSQYNWAKLVQEKQNANSHSELTSKKYMC